MTCSPARLAANKANAQRSTGPRTPQGKARSSRNHSTHGLAADHIRLTHRERARLCRLRKMWHDHFHPQTPEELQLAEQGAYASLISERVDAITFQAHHLGEIATAATFNIRYGPRWERQLFRSLRLLRQAVSRRRKAAAQAARFSPVNTSNPTPKASQPKTNHPLTANDFLQPAHSDPHAAPPRPSAPANTSNPTPDSTQLQTAQRPAPAPPPVSRALATHSQAKGTGSGSFGPVPVPFAVPMPHAGCDRK